MATRYYAVDTGEGGELCSGVSSHERYRVAQAHADRLGETVYLYEVGSDAAPEAIEPESDCDTGDTGER